MIRVTNKQTGCEVIIYGVRNISGQVVAIDKVGERYINAHNAELTYTGTNADGVQTFAINEGFELLTKGCKPKAPKRPTREEVKREEPKSEEKKEYFVPYFNDMLRDLKGENKHHRKYNVYQYGAAGCGKSHTAEQLARALNVKFYGQTTLQFAHDVKGYGDANGNLVQTPFYQAFVHGGLYHQDEYDRSYQEAMIQLNNALANGYFDFPVVGRKYAHRDFYFIASGNTQMTGASDGYGAAQEQDVSCIDRFGAFYNCVYNHDVEVNAIAYGDEELVLFVEAVRRALKELNSQHVVSYRTTAYLSDHDGSDLDRQKALIRSTFKTLDIDQLHNIYDIMKDDSKCNTSSVWFKSFSHALSFYNDIINYNI